MNPPLPLSPSHSNYLHVKLVCGWGLIVFLDAVIGFRLEYLYPAIMFLRSVLDSYKYQGLVRKRGREGGIMWYFYF